MRITRASWLRTWAHEIAGGPVFVVLLYIYIYEFIYICVLLARSVYVAGCCVLWF